MERATFAFMTFAFVAALFVPSVAACPPEEQLAPCYGEADGDHFIVEQDPYSNDVHVYVIVGPVSYRITPTCLVAIVAND